MLLRISGLERFTFRTWLRVKYFRVTLCFLVLFNILRYFYFGFVFDQREGSAWVKHCLPFSSFIAISFESKLFLYIGSYINRMSTNNPIHSARIQKIQNKKIIAERFHYFMLQIFVSMCGISIQSMLSSNSRSQIFSSFSYKITGTSFFIFSV